jgi:hypothetical protein
MARQRETRWTVVKDYVHAAGDNLTDTWPILFGTQADADAAKARLESGQDKSWFDPAGNDFAGYEAFLYVEQITL